MSPIFLLGTVLWGWQVTLVHQVDFAVVQALQLRCTDLGHIRGAARQGVGLPVHRLGTTDTQVVDP